jgi:uncharacterized protein YjbJ (UPF0337 family)
MDALQINGHWNTIKGKLKQHWAKLAEVDLHLVQGKQRALVEGIEESTGPPGRRLRRRSKWHALAGDQRQSAGLAGAVEKINGSENSVNDHVSDKMMIKFSSPNTSPNGHARQVKRGLELGRASGGTERCANAPPQSGKAS